MPFFKLNFQERKLDKTVLFEWQEGGNGMQSEHEVIEINIQENETGPVSTKILKVAKTSLMKLSDVFVTMMKNKMKEAVTKKILFVGFKYETIHTISQIINNLILLECNITPEVCK